MEYETKVDSVTADIEPTVYTSEATSRVEDPRLAELSESAVFPVDASELNAVMELIKQELSQIDPLEPIIDFDELEAPAVGVATGGESEGGGIIRVDRIVEGVNGNEYAYETTVQDIQNEFLGLSDGEQQIEDSIVVPTAPEVIDNEDIAENSPEVDPEKDPEEGENPIEEIDDEQDPPAEAPEDNTTEEPDPTPPEEEEIVPGEPEDPTEEDHNGHQPESPVDDRPDVEPPRGPQGNNGWGNGDQNAPGNSGPNNNAENNTSGKEDPRGGGKVKAQNLSYDDLLEDNKSTDGFNGTSGVDLMLLQLNMDINN